MGRWTAEHYKGVTDRLLGTRKHALSHGEWLEMLWNGGAELKEVLEQDCGFRKKLAGDAALKEGWKNGKELGLKALFGPYINNQLSDDLIRLTEVLIEKARGYGFSGKNQKEMASRRFDKRFDLGDYFVSCASADEEMP